MPSFDEVVDRQRQDPEFRRLWDRAAIARAVANAVVAYRTSHGWSQRALAQHLGWKPSQVARLELGEHNPSLETLMHLSNRLGLQFTVEVSPVGKGRLKPRKQRSVERVENADGTRVLVLAG